ncbi:MULTISPECIES: hypothetical protein [unclassified Methylobacterium]|uniref:hypothetical protein n=1 Tax=unclassified Methylobacterium TaxID=2615210 RepID=UPI0011C1DEAB|nr:MULTISPECIES: hypothetical protein [unclassified Methylobacterium]QEE39309.1 hypothetical protein FVA80_10515 [Methylobacterium sp. WL1]TXM99202.1 hypothetical protein FV242_26310 [Methylobacterium sp. WL64]TXN54227.1 hypothetical protein FV241_24885 [Methylobacterium sp. WL2]
MSGSDKPGTKTLLTLAGILGIPVEQFFDDESATDGQAEAQECLRLWSAIRTSEGRARALTVIRGIIEDERR